MHSITFNCCKISSFVFILFVVLFTACSPEVSTTNSTYKVPKATTAIIVDGKAEEASWLNAETLSFNNYYKVIREEDKQKTDFKMLWDDEYLYLFYACTDKHITARERERDGQPFVDDCAEVFLIPAPEKENMHFGYELNLYKVANDFIFINEAIRGSKLVVKAYSPDYKVEVTVSGTINDDSDVDKGWTMEMAIPRKAFLSAGEFTPIEAGARWSFMALRQDRNEIEGKRITTSTLFPLLADRQVHNPKSFGTLEFTD